MKDNWDSKWSEYIKSTLDEYEPSIPEEHWEQLEAKIQVSSTGFFLSAKFIAGSILSIGLALASYFLIPVHDNMDSSNIELSKQEQVDYNVSKEKVLEIKLPSKELKTNEVKSFKAETAISPLTKGGFDKAQIALSEESEESFIAITPSEPLYHLPLSSKAILQGDLNKLMPLVLKQTGMPKEKKKRAVKKEFNYGGEVGGRSIDNWSFIAGIHTAYKRNRLGLYGGIYYNPKQIREFISGEGSGSSTIKVLSTDVIQHRIHFSTGLSLRAYEVKKIQVHVNAGVLSKSISLNGYSEFYTPLLFSTGVEVRYRVWKRLNSGLHYQYLFNNSKEKQKGHQLGLRIYF